jgi:hypothetical protein
MYAVKQGTKIVVRMLPSMAVAKKVAAEMGGKAIIDPRSLTR